MIRISPTVEPEIRIIQILNEEIKTVNQDNYANGTTEHRCDGVKCSS